MKFASVRVVTANFEALVGFYEKLTGTAATRLAPGFAQLAVGGGVLAISSAELIDRFNGGAIVPKANRSLMLEFEVDDVEAVKAASAGVEIIQQPTVMPWGNVSMLIRDPDGAVVNVFSRPAR